VNGLYLVAIGNLPERALDWVESAVAEWFPFPIRRLPPLQIPEGAFDAKRGQYQSVDLMKMLAPLVRSVALMRDRDHKCLASFSIQTTCEPAGRGF
jgi:hypothetical protein